jgi:hypothetical protein
MARRAVFARRAAERRQHALLVEEQTRHLYAAILGAAGDTHAAEKARELTLGQAHPAGTGKPAKAEPRVGSFEAALARFGAPEWGEEPEHGERFGQVDLPGDR